MSPTNTWEYEMTCCRTDLRTDLQTPLHLARFCLRNTETRLNLTLEEWRLRVTPQKHSRIWRNADDTRLITHGSQGQTREHNMEAVPGTTRALWEMMRAGQIIVSNMFNSKVSKSILYSDLSSICHLKTPPTRNAFPSLVLFVTKY